MHQFFKKFSKYCWDRYGRAFSRKKGHVYNFSEKGQKRPKYLKLWAKMYKIIWKYFEKGQPYACDYHMHETARICPVLVDIVWYAIQITDFRASKYFSTFTTSSSVISLKKGPCSLGFFKWSWNWLFISPKLFNSFWEAFTK